jgi:nitrate reductase gamma subunit
VSTVTRRSGGDQSQTQRFERSMVRGLLHVTMLAIASVLAIVALNEQAVDQIAPAAIGAISTVTLAAIGAVGLVLRRGPRGNRRT